MYLSQHLLGIFFLVWTNGREGIHETLVSACGHQTTFHAQLFHRSGKTEAIHQHADGADQTGLVHENLVGGCRHIIATGRADISDHHIQGYGRILGTQTANLVVDLTCLNRTTARTIDPQDHSLGTRVLEGILQTRDQIVGTRCTVSGNHSLHVHQRGVFARIQRAFALIEPAHEDKQDDKKVSEGERLEENTPVPRAALLLNSRHRQLLQHISFPILL